MTPSSTSVSLNAGEAGAQEPDFAEADFCEPDFLATAHVVIVGLGLMGGSLAFALRNKCAHLTGIDPDPVARDLALHRCAVDQVAADLAGQYGQPADLIVLAAPVRTIVRLLPMLPGIRSERTVVFDLGSTKSQITAAMAGLPARFEPVGGHPICGKEVSGMANATADLFRGAPFVLTALPRTTARARRAAEAVVRAVGARPLWLDAEDHDRGLAATSHLPYLVASALALGTPADVAPLVGPGFRSTTRVAASSPAMMLDILCTNQENILEALERFRAELDRLASGLARGDWDGLEGILRQAAQAQTSLTAAHDAGGAR